MISVTAQRRFWFLLLFAGLTACEEPVDLGFQIADPKLVISSNFFPDETVKLRITGSRSALSSEALQPVEDATVHLFEGNRHVAELVYHPANARYESLDFMPLSGRTYTISVSAPDYAPVHATSSIPEPVEVRDIHLTHLTVTEQGNERYYDYLLELTYDDPADEVNYYDLRLHQEVVPYTVAYNGDTLRHPARLKSILPAADEPDEAASRDRIASFLVEDMPDGEPFRAMLRSSILIKEELLGQLRAELRTVSPEYYRFQRSLGVERRANPDGLSQPVVLFNNVSEGGIGIFAGYNRSVRVVAFGRQTH